MIKRDETDRAGAGRADSIPENSFKNQRDNDRAPADENRRRIKIRDRRTFLQIHPRNQTEGVNREREQQKIKRRSRFKRPAPSEPRRAREQKREHVKRHALAERLKPIEQEFERRPFRRVRLFFREPIGHELDMLIEMRAIIGAIGVADLRIPQRSDEFRRRRPSRSKLSPIECHHR